MPSPFCPFLHLAKQPALIIGIHSSGTGSSYRRCKMGVCIRGIKANARHYPGCGYLQAALSLQPASLPSMARLGCCQLTTCACICSWPPCSYRTYSELSSQNPHAIPLGSLPVPYGTLTFRLPSSAFQPFCTEESERGCAVKRTRRSHFLGNVTDAVKQKR